MKGGGGESRLSLMAVRIEIPKNAAIETSLQIVMQQHKVHLSAWTGSTWRITSSAPTTKADRNAVDALMGWCVRHRVNVECATDMQDGTSW